MEDPFESLRDFPWDISPEDHTPFTRIPWAKPPWSEEQHAAHRERMMGNTLNKGKLLPQETKDKISAAKKGRKHTKEQISARTGRNLKPDHLMTKHGLYCRKWREKQRELGKLGKLAQRPPEDAQ